MSQLVLVEADRNIQDHLSAAAWVRYRDIVSNTGFELARSPDPVAVAECAGVTGDKDAHVLGAAMAADCLYLLTLDKRLARAVNREDLSVSALSPGEFITRVLVTHDEYR